MLVSMNWINDFVDLSGEDIPALIKRFTLATAEVEDVITKGSDISGVVVGKILTCEMHPNSKKLHLLTVDKGDEVVNVVCGAPNARAGITVALATIGGSVCGKPIGKAMLAGYESCGMCCSEAELGLSSENAGIMELDDSLKAGTSIKDVFPIDDVIFEVDNKSLTNRPDLWGHYGIAREFAALTGKPLKAVPVLKAEDYASLPSVSLTSTDEMLLRYVAVKAENITANISPAYIKIRLYYCGLRPINLLADLTNYVMLELGQPMHAFDGRKVEAVEIKRFEKPFEFITLDGQARAIDNSNLMICADNTPSAVAGVMGGLDSEIAPDTTSLLLESACFDAAAIRRTSVKLGLRTDASARYEKSLDPENSMTAALRFMKLLLEICPETKITSNFTDLYIKHFDIPVITFDKTYIDRYTGIDIPSETIVKTLTSLGFGVEQSGEAFTVTVPSWRATKDVSIKADLVEEVTRVYGYDNFPFITARSPLYPVKPSISKTDENTAKDILSRRYKLHEVHSYIWYDSKKNKDLKLSLAPNLKVINAQTADHETLRADMIPSLLYFVNENKGFGDDFGIYEVGHTVKGDKNSKATEQKQLGIALYSRSTDEEFLLFKARDIIAAFTIATRGANPEFINIKPEQSFCHPKNTSEIFISGISCGYISILHPTIKNTIDKKANIIIAQINLTEYAEIPGINLSYNESPKYPGIDFDLTIPAPKDSRFSDISKAWTESQHEHLKSVSLIDIYGDTTKNITVRLSFSAPDRTLSMEEVNAHITTITSRLSDMGITIRR
ncbi:MAG: phenylalanine--tRNA ligase subunit beta [Ruminococcus sp.]|jgi:phenylalanyl-tRNA synthetase beta chain|nr:phenylalanine--tRNA ligase subunit beta [Ruminococcus sp.]